MRGGGFDLVLLDLGLPDGDGLELLKRLRAERVPVPVICLTARAQETDVVMGLRQGADDYVTKPFGLSELRARIEAVLRRAAPKGASGARLELPGGIVVDLEARTVTRAGRAEELTPTEVELFRYFRARRGEALERAAILRDLWGLGPHDSSRTLDNHVARLRRKIEADPAEPRVLVTVHGVGYRMEDGGAATGS
jgi:DNA-binding response OmpR family regulator